MLRLRFGLFSATSDHALYPSTSAFAKFPQAADLYTFLGKVVGKAGEGDRTVEGGGGW